MEKVYMHESAAGQEMLFTVDDKYLHVQRTDADEIDYTIYDQNNFEEIDGGQIIECLLGESNEKMLTGAAIEICADYGFGYVKRLQAVDISILEDIHAMEAEEMLAKKA